MYRNLVMALAIATLIGQANPSRLSFEVATIKPSTALDDGGSAGFQLGGRFRAINFAALNMILSAYGTRQRSLFRSQIIGAPEWATTARYDITARVGDALAGSSPGELSQKMPALLQSLLEDRFKLKAHRETRERPIYALRLLNRDGALGPRMRRSAARCPDDREKCSLHFSSGHITGGALSMQQLLGILSANADRVVVDQTGLEGAFEVDLEWSLDQSTSDKPSFFGAVQEELGLKLDAGRGPVDVLVVEHMEKPTED